MANEVADIEIGLEVVKSWLPHQGEERLMEIDLDSTQRWRSIFA